jgi:hypothetical protein
VWLPSRDRPAADRGPAELAAAVAAYLEISRSPLRWSDPGSFSHRETAAWERLRTAAGLPGEGPTEPGPSVPTGLLF